MFLLEAVWNSVVSVATEELNGPILRACVGYRIAAEPLFLLKGFHVTTELTIDRDSSSRAEI